MTEVLTAAYKKTAAAKSAKVCMTMVVPTAMDGGGAVEMSGVMGWGPTVMDMTMVTKKLGEGLESADQT